MPAPLLRIAHLTKKYGNATVVDDLSLEIMPGECLGVIGPNGAGKTTTIRVCLGLTGPDAGEIEAFGLALPAQVREAKKRIGVVTQFDSLDPDFTCAENLRVYGAYFGLPRAVIDERVPRLLEFAALQSKANARPGELSGGMKRRLSLGRALINDPDLLILDEPTTGLDPQARRNLWDVISGIAAAGRTVILTTHYLDEAESLCDRVAIMDGGTIIALDSPQGLISTLADRARVLFDGHGLDEDALSSLAGVSHVAQSDGHVELTSATPQQTLVELIALAEARGASLGALAVRQPTLEDVFLEATGREFRS